MGRGSRLLGHLSKTSTKLSFYRTCYYFLAKTTKGLIFLEESRELLYVKQEMSANDMIEAFLVQRSKRTTRSGTSSAKSKAPSCKTIQNQLAKSINVARIELAERQRELEKWRATGSHKPATISDRQWEVAERVGELFASSGRFLCEHWTAQELADIMGDPFLHSRFQLISGEILLHKRQEEIESMETNLKELNALTEESEHSQLLYFVAKSTSSRTG
jgi:hypothetical protein